MRKHRGAILFELLVSIAIFVGAGTLTLSVVSNSYSSLQRAERLQFAVDIARSKLAELEAGLINITDLQAGIVETIGSLELIEDSYSLSLDPMAEEESEWWIETDTQQTEFDGLTLVEITVYLGPEEDAPSITLRQLVRLREIPVDEYQEDEFLEGLPTEEGGS